MRTSATATRSVRSSMASSLLTLLSRRVRVRSTWKLTRYVLEEKTENYSERTEYGLQTPDFFSALTFKSLSVLAAKLF